MLQSIAAFHWLGTYSECFHFHNFIFTHIRKTHFIYKNNAYRSNAQQRLSLPRICLNLTSSRYKIGAIIVHQCRWPYCIQLTYDKVLLWKHQNNPTSGITQNWNKIYCKHVRARSTAITTSIWPIIKFMIFIRFIVFHIMVCAEWVK